MHSFKRNGLSDFHHCFDELLDIHWNRLFSASWFYEQVFTYSLWMECLGWIEQSAFIMQKFWKEYFGFIVGSISQFITWVESHYVKIKKVPFSPSDRSSCFHFLLIKSFRLVDSSHWKYTNMKEQKNLDSYHKCNFHHKNSVTQKTGTSEKPIKIKKILI